MDNRLKQLFGYQHLAENRELQQVIDSVHAKYAMRELSLDEMEMVAAAASPILSQSRRTRISEYGEYRNALRAVFTAKCWAIFTHAYGTGQTRKICAPTCLRKCSGSWRNSIPPRLP